VSCQLKNIRIAQFQILYCKLEIEINTKIKIFSIYIVLLYNKKTFENSRINIRINIIAIYRDLISLHLFLTNIFYCFKATIDFFYIFDIQNAILEYAS